MNKQRRNKIKNIINWLEKLTENDLKSINIIKLNIEKVLDEEQDAYDNIPENLQYSRRGEESEEAIDSLQEAYDFLDEINEQMSEEEIENLIDEAIDALDYIL